MTSKLKKIIPIVGPLDASIRPPGSKSLTNRALLLAAVARGETTLEGILDCDDSRVMLAALRQIGIPLTVDWSACRAVVTGCGGVLPVHEHQSIDVQNSGTTMRFLAAMLAACGGRYEMFGVPRMHQRPIGELVRALQVLGGEISAAAEDEFPPVRIDSRGLNGGEITIAGNRSSQFLSGLLMAAPLARGPIEIRVAGDLVSQPYVALTLDLMSRFGVAVEVSAEGQSYRVCPQEYLATQLTIEPDASAASYFFAAAAICGGRVTVEGLGRNSLQGDVRFTELLEQMGCSVSRGLASITVSGPAKKGIVANMGDCSDTAQTLAAVAMTVEGPTTIRGIAHNRIKETDRVGNLAIELRNLGATVTELADGLIIEPPESIRPARIRTYDDHRMAMSMALVGLRAPGVEIENPGCVAKTYPRFFEDLESLRPQ